MNAVSIEILRLAVPSILANLCVPRVGMVDIAVAGHLDSSAAALIGGISIGTLMFDLLYWNFGFLRVGTGGLTAQALGRGDSRDCSSHLVMGLSFALLFSLAILMLQFPIDKLIFLVLDCSPEVKELAPKYFHVRVWAAPATLSLMVFRGWFIGMQNTVSSMLTDLVVNGTNIAASIFLALGVRGTSFGGLGFIGVAWGTVIAQYLGLFFALALLLFKYRPVLNSLSPRELGWVFRRESVKRFFSVNGDLFVRSMALIIVYLAFTALSARYGDLLLAVVSIMMKLLMIFSYFTDGFAFAAEALTGRYVGMRSVEGVRETVKWTFVWSMGLGMLFVGIYALTGLPLFRMMTSDTSVVEASRQFLPWLILMPLVGTPAFSWDGIYQGATATAALRNASIGCVIAFYAVWFAGLWLLKPEGSQAIHLLFAAYFAHLAFRSLYQTLMYRKSIIGSIGA